MQKRIGAESVCSGLAWTRFVLTLGANLAAAIPELSSLLIPLWTAIPLLTALALVAEAHPIDRILLLEMDRLQLVEPGARRNDRSSPQFKARIADRFAWLRRAFYFGLDICVWSLFAAVILVRHVGGGLGNAWLFVLLAIVTGVLCCDLLGTALCGFRFYSYPVVAKNK